MANHSSILAWKIPWTEEPGRLQSMGVTKSRTRLSHFTSLQSLFNPRKLRIYYFTYFSGNSTGVDCCFLPQGIFPTQGWNPGLPHCRQTLYRLSQLLGQRYPKFQGFHMHCQLSPREAVPLKRIHVNYGLPWWLRW